MKPFPIFYLNDRITEVSSKVKSIDILQQISNGLNNEIQLIETEGPCTCPAAIEGFISPMDGKMYCNVSISAAFMQCTWLVCEAAMWLHDVLSMQTELAKHSIRVNQLLSNIQFIETDASSRKQLKYIQSAFNAKVDVYHNLQCIRVIRNRKLLDYEMEVLYKRHDMSSDFGTYVNSVYVYGMPFVSLHELAHFALGHLAENESLKSETEADEFAFNALYTDLDGKEKATAMYGLICVLTTLVFVDSSLHDDGIHPLPFRRIYTYYHQIVDEHTKARFFLRGIIFLWAEYTGNTDVKNKVLSTDLSMDELELYLYKLEDNANMK